MDYAFWADVVVAFHLAYVGYVVLGQLAIVVGVVLRQSWARNPWFRISHLVAILIVAAEALANITCPLTTLEADLRTWAGQQVAEGSFVGRLMHDILFIDLDPSWGRVLHIGFGALVLGTFLLAPPRFRRSTQPMLSQSNAVACPRC